jgi:hypothetical protein
MVPATFVGEHIQLDGFSPGGLALLVPPASGWVCAFIFFKRVLWDHRQVDWANVDNL